MELILASIGLHYIVSFSPRELETFAVLPSFKKTVKIEVLTWSLDLGVNVSSLSISSHGGCLSTTVCFNSGDTCSSTGSSVEEDIFRSYVKVRKEGLLSLLLLYFLIRLRELGSDVCFALPNLWFHTLYHRCQE